MAFIICWYYNCIIINIDSEITLDKFFAYEITFYKWCGVPIIARAIEHVGVIS